MITGNNGTLSRRMALGVDVDAIQTSLMLKASKGAVSRNGSQLLGAGLQHRRLRPAPFLYVFPCSYHATRKSEHSLARYQHWGGMTEGKYSTPKLGRVIH